MCGTVLPLLLLSQPCLVLPCQLWGQGMSYWRVTGSQTHGSAPWAPFSVTTGLPGVVTMAGGICSMKHLVDLTGSRAFKVASISFIMG